MFLCFIINRFNDKTISAMGAATLPNLIHLSMLTLRKLDVTSVVSQTVFVEDFVELQIVVNCALKIVFQLFKLIILLLPLMKPSSG